MRVCISYQDTVNGSFGRGNLRGNFFLLYYYKVRVRRVATRVAPMKSLQEMWGKNPPVTALPCQPPLGKGAKGTGVRIATGALRPRNDTAARGAIARADVGSELSAASGRRSEVSEWPRSKFQASAARQRKNFGHRNRIIGPYGGGYKGYSKTGRRGRRPLRMRYKKCRWAGRCRHRPLRKRYKGCSARQAGDRKGRPYGGFTKDTVGRGMPYTHTYAYTLYTPAKASQSLPPAGGKKIQIIFHRDMCVGKNTSQAASVEFCRLRQNYARSRLQTPLAENSVGIFCQ